MRSIYVLAFLAASAFSAAQARAAFTLVEKDSWKVSMGGFVETDAIFDSTRSLVETIGNTPVDRADTVAGQTGRAQFSVRNSRLSFAVEPPAVDEWKTKGYFEFDLLGFDPSPGTANNTEGGFFNNPTFRARHVYLDAQKDGWQLLAGQYWMLFGWQPYYFIPTLQVAPIPGMLYSRTAQLRAVKTVEPCENTTAQAALGVMRPPERDASLPGFEGGLRLALGGRTAGFTGGATGAQKAQPASIGVSGALREIVIPDNVASPNGETKHFLGSALAIDTLIPILASNDGKDVGNTLMVGAEFSTGTGYGDQFTSWTGNLANPLSSVATAPEKNVNLDAGIGGFDSASKFYLVDLRSFNAYLQYHLPTDWRTWMSAGYGELFSDNIDNLIQLSGVNAGKTSAGKVPYHRERAFFGNIAHDLTKQLRVGVEFAHIRTSYLDNMVAHDNRVQLSAWFIF